MSKSPPLEIGRTYEVKFPFVRDEYDDFDISEEGISTFKRPTWRPGTESEQIAPDDVEAVADGIGKMLLTVVSVHELPKPYSARVFYIREWIDPDGKRFGDKQLRMVGIAAFRSRANCYRVGYRMRIADPATAGGSALTVTAVAACVDRAHEQDKRGDLALR